LEKKTKKKKPKDTFFSTANSLPFNSIVSLLFSWLFSSSGEGTADRTGSEVGTEATASCELGFSDCAFLRRSVKPELFRILSGY
jgi:hypothetical protein